MLFFSEFKKGIHIPIGGSVYRCSHPRGQKTKLFRWMMGNTVI